MPIILIFPISCQRIATEKNPIIETRFLLGAPLSIQLLNGGTKELLDKIYTQIEYIEYTMSTSLKDYSSSEILDINNKSSTLSQDEFGTYTISTDTAIVLEKSLYIANSTKGAFDPSIAPLVELWGWSSGNQKVPSNKEIQELLPLIDWQSITVRSYSGSTKQELTMRGQQRLDVGGIAKGYAADLAREALLVQGVTSAIIDFGGNVITIGSKSDKSLWKIGIQEPYVELGSIVAVLETEETAIVTSGVYERYFEEEGMRYSHVINPKDGQPIDNELLSVTIVCKESIIADGLSTGILILGLEEGMTLVEQTEGIEAVFITKNNTLHISEGLHRSTTNSPKITIISEEYVIK